MAKKKKDNAAQQKAVPSENTEQHVEISTPVTEDGITTNEPVLEQSQEIDVASGDPQVNVEQEDNFDSFVAELDEVMEETTELPSFESLPENELSPACKLVKTYLDTMAAGFPPTDEMFRLNSRLRGAIYAILETTDVPFAALQLRNVINLAKAAPDYAFSTSVTFQHFEKMRWHTGQRYEYEGILLTLSKICSWKTQEDAENYSWERLRTDIRADKTEHFVRVILAAIGAES